MNKLIYHYDQDGYYIGNSPARKDPKETQIQKKDIFLLPKNATFIEMKLESKDDEKVKWNGKKWIIEQQITQELNIADIAQEKIQELENYYKSNEAKDTKITYNGKTYNITNSSSLRNLLSRNLNLLLADKNEESYFSFIVNNQEVLNLTSENLTLILKQLEQSRQKQFQHKEDQKSKIKLLKSDIKIKNHDFKTSLKFI